MPFQVEHHVDLPTNTPLRATCKNVEVVEVPYTDRKTGEQKTFTKLKWSFEITQQGEYFGMSVTSDTEAKFSDAAHNQPRAWSEALLGRALNMGTVINESDVIGLPCLITVKYEQDRRDSSKQWRRVEDVYPITNSDEPPF